jgi:peptide subunit release factor 1 (eRF1)
MTDAERLRRILAFRAHGYPVVSVYLGIPGDPGQRPDPGTRVDNLLHQIRPLARDGSLRRAARMSIRADLDRIEAAARRGRWRPGAVAVFACSGRDLFEEVALPRSVRDRIMVDAAPWVRPMTAVLDGYPRCAFVLADRGPARVWELWRGDLRECAGDDDLAGFDVLVVGGREPASFAAALPGEVGRRVAATVTVDPATTTVDDVRRYAELAAENYDRGRQQSRVAEVFDAPADSGRTALGLTQCLRAGSVGAVRALVVEDDTTAAGVVCEACGWLGLAGDTCAACGCPVRRSADVIDELVESVIDQGGSVRRIGVSTRLAGWVAAATLRFPLREDTGVEDLPSAEIVTSGLAG